MFEIAEIFIKMEAKYAAREKIDFTT